VSDTANPGASRDLAELGLAELRVINEDLAAQVEALLAEAWLGGSHVALLELAEQIRADQDRDREAADMASPDWPEILRDRITRARDYGAQLGRLVKDQQ
jgi:hypothetical protein